MASLYQKSSVSNLFLIFASCLACLYVAGRLWSTSRELHYVRGELKGLKNSRRTAQAIDTFPYLDSPGNAETSTVDEAGADKVLFYNYRASSGPSSKAPLSGASIEEDLPATQLPGDENILGQIDTVEGGAVSGWACKRGYTSTPLQVVVYVDGIRAGEVRAGDETPHHIIHRLCELDMGNPTAQEQPKHVGVGFTIRLPELPKGKHEVRAFVMSVEGTFKQELNQSPLAFIELVHEPGMEEALKRKDSIIRVRNAQISALWDELHTRQPWRNAVNGAGISFPDDDKGHAEPDAANVTARNLVVIGINTGLGANERRMNLRNTWVPQGDALKKLEIEKGVVIRFVVGYSEQKDDPDEAIVQGEMKQYNDIIRLDMVDTYADLPLKTLKMFTVLPQRIDADFYFKIDDDVAVNVEALASYLQQRRSQGNLYLGCMKSGQVLTDRRYKWFEPEYWRFGDPASNEGSINYPRHASGQVYGLSQPIARYIGKSASVLHRFANEDVTLGTWLVGLEVQYVDERRLCCDSPEKCAAQTGEGNLCLSYYEHQCAGICSSEQRLSPIWNACLKDPLHRDAVQAAKAMQEVAVAYTDAGTEGEAEDTGTARRRLL